jgi:hypothetical protein
MCGHHVQSFILRHAVNGILDSLAVRRTQISINYRCCFRANSDSYIWDRPDKVI